MLTVKVSNSLQCIQRECGSNLRDASAAHLTDATCHIRMRWLPAALLVVCANGSHQSFVFIIAGKTFADPLKGLMSVFTVT